MRIRHRIPTVFSLYMVDVLCCALGCVMLMWLTNLQTSEEQTKLADEKLAAANQREERTKKETEERAILAGKLLADAEKRAGYTSDQLKDTSLDRDTAYLMLAKSEADKDALKA